MQDNTVLYNNHYILISNDCVYKEKYLNQIRIEKKKKLFK